MIALSAATAFGMSSGRTLATDPVRSFRMLDEFMNRIDAWSLDQEGQHSRAVAIRRLVEMGLKMK